MKNKTLALVTDESYMEHLHRNISGTEWIIQGRATGKIFQGLLAEWSTSAGIYCGKLLGIFAVQTFLLTTEDYYRASTKEQTGNTVSCDTMVVLHTFAKKPK